MSYEYDEMERVKKIADEVGGETRYEYCSVGNRTKVSTKISADPGPDGTWLVTRYTYTNRNQVDKVIADDGGLEIVTSYVYDIVGRMTDVTADEGGASATTTHYVYDNLGRRTSVTAACGTAVAPISAAPLGLGPFFCVYEGLTPLATNWRPSGALQTEAAGTVMCRALPEEREGRRCRAGKGTGRDLGVTGGAASGVPEGRPRLAPPFMAGWAAPQARASPGGTDETLVASRPAVPPGLRAREPRTPRHKWRGYIHSAPAGAERPGRLATRRTWRR